MESRGKDPGSGFSLTIRHATLEDKPELTSLIARSARELSADDYTPEQIEGALRGAFGIDTQLILDRTYFVAEADGKLVACGGWSKRRTLFGGDARSGRDAAELDPATDAAKIRAFFVDPAHARRGLGSAILERCESEAKACGFRSFEMMATLPGARLYSRYGYSGTERVRYEMQPGLTIEFIPMTKNVAGYIGGRMIRSTMQRVPLSSNTLLERAGKIYPQSEVVSRLPDKSLHRYRFADFYRRSRQLASALLAAGMKKGDRVATLSWNHYAHFECYFGIPAGGGVLHTLNLRLAPEEIAWIANHAEDRFLIVDDCLLPLLAKFQDQVKFEKIIVVPLTGAPVPAPYVDYEKFLADAPADFEYPEHDEDDPIAMCYTSGTTGRPKGVVYSHRSMVLHTLVGNQPDHWNLAAKDSVLPVTPMFHANCWGIPYGAAMMGIKLIFPGPHLGAADLIDLFMREKPTYSLGVPTIWISILQLLDSEPERYRMPAGARMIVGGSAVPESLIRGFARHGVSVLQGWGMTETSPLASGAFVKPELQHYDEEQRIGLATTAGIPAPLVDLRIVGDGDKVQPWDGHSVGEIQVRGNFITGSYHNVPIEPDKFTRDGWLRTGDVASVDAHGYIRIVDRTKDLIKSGGEWISSVDMENELMGHAAVAEAAVIAVPDAKWSERPLACVVFRPGKSATADELRAHLANRFAKWQLPERFEFLDAIPRTSTGKFWKTKLRDRFRGSP